MEPRKFDEEKHIKEVLKDWKCNPILEECSPHPFQSYGLFTIGLIAAICYRVLVVFEHVSPTWVRPLWYIGSIGFLIFFIHRYQVSRKRHNAIKKYQLIQKLKSTNKLEYEERAAVIELLTSLDKSLEKYNFMAIFVLTIIAIVVDIILSTANM